MEKTIPNVADEDPSKRVAEATERNSDNAEPLMDAPVKETNTSCLNSYTKTKMTAGELVSEPTRKTRPKEVRRSSEEGRRLTLETSDRIGPSMLLHPVIRPKKHTGRNLLDHTKKKQQTTTSTKKPPAHISTVAVTPRVVDIVHGYI